MQRVRNKMRYHQLVLESNYMDDLKDEILNLLTIASARGINNLRTSFLVKDLKNLGFEVDTKSILDAMNDIDIVSSADANKIQLSSNGSSDKTDDVNIPKYDETPFGGFDDKEKDNKSPVDKAAARQAVKDLKL